MDISILFCSKNDPGLDFVQEGDTREAIRNEYEYGEWKLKRGLPEFLWRHASFAAEYAAEITTI
jgi:hypothetical protein